MSDKLLQNAIIKPAPRATDSQDEMKVKRVAISQQMAKEMQFLFAKLLYTNQSYVDPSNVLENVVDESGKQCAVGEQQDSMEYLLNFMERLEEGLSEDSTRIGSHMRVSDFQKRSDECQESFLMDSSEMAQSTLNSS